MYCEAHRMQKFHKSNTFFIFTLKWSSYYSFIWKNVHSHLLFKSCSAYFEFPRKIDFLVECRCILEGEKFIFYFVIGHRGHMILLPPSMARVWPVMKEAALEARKAIVEATSSTVPTLPMACVVLQCSKNPWYLVNKGKFNYLNDQSNFYELFCCFFKTLKQKFRPASNRF